MGFPTNIFVLCTGRCGSMTLARACDHITNYTSAHEGRTHALGADRLAYPARHIEIDNRLSWFLGRLDRTFGDNAAYVHLIRDPDDVARSYAGRSNQGILRAYRTAIVSRAARRNPKARVIDFSRDYVDTVTENLTTFLRDKTHVMVIRLETLGPDFDRFIDWIGATGDLDAAQAELLVRHNASERKA